MKICAFAPAGSFSIETFNKAAHFAKKNGILIEEEYEDICLTNDTSFVNGSAHARLDQLKTYANKNPNYLWAVRGGVGATDFLNYDISFLKGIKIIGYSDITALLLQNFLTNDETGVHASVLSDLHQNSPVMIEKYRKIIFEHQKTSYPKLEPLVNEREDSGKLIVMNLSVLVSLLGTLNVTDFAGTILALEEINEPLYKVYRYFSQLNNWGVFARIKTLILGDFSLPIDKVFNECLMPFIKNKDITVWHWPIFGHIKENNPLIFGQPSVIKKFYDKYFLNYE